MLRSGGDEALTSKWAWAQTQAQINNNSLPTNICEDSRYKNGCADCYMIQMESHQNLYFGWVGRYCWLLPPYGQNCAGLGNGDYIYI